VSATIDRDGGIAVPKTIKELRVAAGLTQLQLANQIQVTPSAVYNWERGKNEPSATNLRDLARALGVSMEDIDLEVWDAKSAA
jgi:transcriptional regulator with XRE-family HTH domain